MAAALAFAGCSGLTTNVAETVADHSDPSLRPRRYDLPYDPFFTALLDAAAGLPRWRVIQHDQVTGEIHATRTTRLFRFVDDVRMRLEKSGEGGVTLNLRSVSRVGKGDFGQNARNIRELLRALDQNLPAARPK